MRYVTRQVEGVYVKKDMVAPYVINVVQVIMAIPTVNLAIVAR